MTLSLYQINRVAARFGLRVLIVKDTDREDFHEIRVVTTRKFNSMIKEGCEKGTIRIKVNR